MKTGRNEPCPCGSGKKYKNCCLNKPKERHTCITVDFGQPTKLDGVGITHDGQVEFIQGERLIEPKKAYYQSFYDRDKGPKILNRIDLHCNEVQANTNSIFLGYDRVFSIDTNTRIIDNQKVSMSGVVLCRLKPSKSGALALFAPVNGLEFRDINSFPEKVAWRRFFEIMVRHPVYKPLSSIAVVVDAHLGDIQAYNSRNKPIIEDFYLPHKIELIYASSDVGKEYLPNRLISMSDKTATELLKYIKENSGYTQGLIKEKDQPFSSFRFWHID